MCLDVVDRAFPLGAGEGQAASDLGADRAGHRRLRLDETQVAIVELKAGFRSEAGLSSRDVDRAGGRVLAEERPLRAAKDFNAFHVEEVERRRRRPREEDAVDVETDAWFDAVVGEPEWGAEPADVDRRVAGV